MKKNSFKSINFILVFSMLLFQACFGPKIYPIKMERTDNNSQSLRLNGYYYLEYERSAVFVDKFFLYSNGVFLDGLVCDLPDLKGYEISVQTGGFDQTAQNNISLWGIYKISDNSIILERWISGNRCCETEIFKGEILNDSTLHIFDDVYKFKALNPKPDSTNTFIN